MSRFCHIWLVCVWLPAAVFAQDADEVIERVQKEYRKTDDYTITFSKIIRWQLSGAVDSLSGVVQIKKEKFRSQIGEQTWVTDGATLWQYSTVTRQLIIETFEEASDDFLPRNLIFKFPEDHDAELLTRQRFDGRECEVLRLTPRNNDTLVQSLTVWVDRELWFMRKMEFLNLDGNTEVYHFTSIQRNTGLSDDLFHFQPPTDAIEVIDLR